jgi:hypothetical protein
LLRLNTPTIDSFLWVSDADDPKELEKVRGDLASARGNDDPFLVIVEMKGNSELSMDNQGIKPKQVVKPVKSVKLRHN